MKLDISKTFTDFMVNRAMIRVRENLDTGLTDFDRECLLKAITLAREAERLGNLPIGAVIALGGTVIAEAGNAVRVPHYHPGRHAEMEALGHVPLELWCRSREMTCYTTLEPCVMCFGALLLHGVGRIVFGAEDTRGGAKTVREHLPEYYADGVGVPAWVGPVMRETCDELYQRVARGFDRLPCGRGSLKTASSIPSDGGIQEEGFGERTRESPL